MSEWRWTDDRGVQRLVGTDELRAALASNVLSPSTLVWREGMSEWTPASTLPELSGAPPNATEDARPKAPTDTSRPSRPRTAPPPPPPRGTIPTLVGMPTPEGDRNGAPPSLAVVVPAPGGSPGPGRAVITLIPRYGGPQTEAEGNAPDIPRAPRLPAPAGLRERTKPQRKLTTNEIDGLWAVPSLDTDDDYTLPLERSPTPTDSAAESSIVEGSPVTLAFPGGSPVVPLKPVPAQAADVKPALESAVNGKPRPAAVPAPEAKKLPVLNERDDDDDATLLKPPKSPEVNDPLPRDLSSSAQGQTKAAATSAEEPVLKPDASITPKAATEAEPGRQGAAAPKVTASNGTPPPPVVVVAEDLTRPGPLEAVPVPKLREAGAGAQATAPKLGGGKPIPFGKPVEITGGRASTQRPPPPPPRPIRPPSKVPPPMPPKARPSAPPSAEDSGLLKVGQIPPPPPLPRSRSTRPPKPPRREDGVVVAPIPALLVPVLPAEDALVVASTDAEAPKPSHRPSSAPSLKPAEARAPAEATEKLSPPTTSRPSPPPAAPAPAITLASEEPPEDISPKPPSTDAALPAPTDELISLPSKLEADAEPSAEPPPDSAAEAKRLRADTARWDAPLEPAKQLDSPVSVPVSSLLGAGGALIFMVISSFFVGRCSAKSPPLVARPSLQALPAIARAAIPEPPKPCWVVRQPVMWAQKASKSIPFDVVPTAQGSLAIGYARDANEAVGIEVSPSSGQVQPRFEQRLKNDIDRVTPMPNAEFQVVTGDSGGLTSAVPVPATPPFFLGVQDGSLVTADRPDSPSTVLWPLNGKDGISAARVQLVKDQGYGLTFRREGAIWSGWLGADRRPIGDLTKVPGSGGSVGKPNSGWNRREFAVIFADRPQGNDHWEIRVGHAPTGQIPTATTVIPLPKGGPGGDAFAPDIAGLPDGRWLLIWTEGATGSRAIRAQTFAHDFTPIGDPIALSPPAGNYGQGVLGVVDNYAGAVFLSKGASNYELWGSMLQCG